ncbi:MAG: hypothetical protein KAS23_16000 [Anaerohalosphaera sp.]|nr:hypothetical protein [Anaerohalosphaera sp.]
MKKNAFYLMVIFAAMIAAVGLAEDPDYGNIWEDATVVPTNGTIVQGVLSANDDLDWFKFTPTVNTLYRVTVNGQVNAGYKIMDVYQIDEFDNLHKTIDQTVWSNATSVRTFFIEAGEDVYIQMRYNAGSYSFYVETLGQYPPDSYSDECDSPTTITVDAAPITGTLTHNPDDSLEVDWFVFDTEPLHMYQIILTKSDNTDLNFQVYSEDCEYILGWSKNQTVTSWFGEQYKLHVAGNPAYLGTYYTLEVIDLGLYPDDYSNISDTAEPITADGTHIDGEIQFKSNYHSDEDWFKFTPTAKTLYRVTMNGEVNKGYKVMKIYQIDEFGNLHLTIDHTLWSDATSVRTFFIEEGDDIYVQLYYDNGDYTFYIEPLGNYPDDSYADSCPEATPITVDAPPTEGTLNHNQNGSLEVDWFVFDTQPLHMYQILLTKCDNTDLNFQVYSENCEYILGWSKNQTVTSWFGEQYRIHVAGNPAYLGAYYTLEVIDLGLYPDDYPNIAANAASIPKDGTLVDGELQFKSSYHSDEDWFTFIAGLEGNYDFMLTGEVGKGYKIIKIYWEDDLGALREKKSVTVWSDAVNNFTVNLPAGKIYVQMYYDNGEYSFSVVSPEPRCGDLDHPYPVGDANHDCFVNLVDMALVAENWLTCTAPGGCPE